jgi:hypothetical protein
MASGNPAGVGTQDMGDPNRAALLTYLASLIAGEDPTLARMLVVNAALVSVTAITTNTSTLVKTGRAVFLGVWCGTAGTAWTVQVRDNATSSAGGTNKGPVTTMAVGNPYQAVLGEKGILCEAGLVLDTAGTTPGSLYALYV